MNEMTYSGGNPSSIFPQKAFANLFFSLVLTNFFQTPEDRRGHRKDVIYWSFCVPAACSPEDVQLFLALAVDVSSLKGLQLDFEVAPNMCQIKREVDIDAYDVALG